MSIEPFWIDPTRDRDGAGRPWCTRMIRRWCSLTGCCRRRLRRENRYGKGMCVLSEGEKEPHNTKTLVYVSRAFYQYFLQNRTFPDKCNQGWLVWSGAPPHWANINTALLNHSHVCVSVWAAASLSSGSLATRSLFFPKGSTHFPEVHNI